MRLIASVIVIPLILALAGCGASKHINREDYAPRENRAAHNAGLRTHQTSSDTFDGSLNILYEKKIKGSADSPIRIVGNLLIFRSTRDRVLFIDQATGERKARIKKRRGIVLDPVVIDSFLVIVRQSQYGEIEVINLFTGSTITKRVINHIRSGPIIVMDRLVFGTVRGIVALSVPDLNTVWENESERIVSAAPATDGNAVYFTADDDKIRAVDPADGTTIWESSLNASVVSDLSAGSLLYFGLSDGRFAAVNKKSGETEWETPLGYQVRGGVAESESAVFTGCTDGSIFRLSRSTGNIVWRYETEGIITAPPLLYHGTVVIGSHDRHVYSIDAETGQLIDRRRVEGAVRYGAVANGKRIFITCRKERLYCFEG